MHALKDTYRGGICSSTISGTFPGHRGTAVFGYLA